MQITVNELLAVLVRERETIAAVMAEEIEPLKMKAKEISAPHREQIRKLNYTIERLLVEDGRQVLDDELLGSYVDKPERYVQGDVK